MTTIKKMLKEVIIFLHIKKRFTLSNKIIIQEGVNNDLSFLKYNPNVIIKTMKTMKTIQEQLAERIYEILPHKKELEFGCEVSFGFSSAVFCGVDNDWVYLESLEPAQPIRKIRKVGKTIKLEIIGQPLRLADFLLAVEQEGKIILVNSLGTLFSSEDLTILGYYNLQEDNILSQSDDFCEWALQILK